MTNTDKRIDAYIAKAPDYAKPILAYLRELAHEACPDVEETLKWSSPAYMHNGILMITAAFKQYIGVNFWKSALIIPGGGVEGTAGDLGKIATIADLPPKKVLLGYIKKAVELNAADASAPKGAAKKGGKLTPKKTAGAAKPTLETPDYFLAALKKNKKANAAFEAFPPSHKREYVQWITEAKTDATREKRMAQALEWIGEGKSRNWKYQ